MIGLIQRVSEASVTVNNQTQSAIGTGLLVLLGIEHADTEEDSAWLSKKIVNLRIFDDENGVMNRSLLDVAGEVIIVSQFTLHASTKKGNRPSYIQAAKPDQAIPLYQDFIQRMHEHTGKAPGTGRFGANMKVHLVNDGPVTISIDTQNKK